jgi:hypothetical protein
MTRPKKKRAIRFNPEVDYFKPRGVLLADLETVEVSLEELEALRLVDVECMKQTEAAENMEISQSTLHRVLVEGRKKIAEALTEGKAIHLKGGDYKMITLRRSSGRGGRGRGGGRGRMGGPYAAGPGGDCECPSCGHTVTHKAGVPCTSMECPKCGTKMVRQN